MDSDDMSLPERLSEQVRFLDGHPSVSVVSTRILLINEQGEIEGDWPGDDGSLTFEQIYKKLPQGNCIAHPSIMIRRSDAVDYPYHPSQINSEDYDLWLRLCADHKMIQKLDRILLKYRVHQESISKISSPFKREWVTFRTKVRFLVNRFKNFHFNKFDLAILGSLLKEPFVLFFFIMKSVLDRNRTK
jgi:glycosyltransferase EpsE